MASPEIDTASIAIASYNTSSKRGSAGSSGRGGSQPHRHCTVRNSLEIRLLTARSPLDSLTLTMAE